MERVEVKHTLMYLTQAYMFCLYLTGFYSQSFSLDSDTVGIKRRLTVYRSSPQQRNNQIDGIQECFCK